MKNWISCATVVLGGWLLVGCAGVEVEIDHDKSYPFQSLKAFTWMPDTDKRKGDPRVYNDLADARVKNAVQAELIAKGYRKVEAEAEADFMVGYHSLLQDKMSAKTVNDFYGYQGVWSNGYWYQPGLPQTYVYEYEQGTLLLDIVDAESQRLVWRGSAQAELDRNPSPAKREKRLKNAVAEILKGFPPQ